MLTASRITTRGRIAGAAITACTLLSIFSAPVSAETPSPNPLAMTQPTPAATTLLMSEANRAATAAMAPAEDRRIVTAQQALQTGDLGSMQEEALLTVVSASTSLAEAHDADAVTARRVLAAQHALGSADLGSLQEEALTAIVVAGRAAEETEDGY